MWPGSPSPRPREACARSAVRVRTALGLVDAFLNPTDGRSHVVHLTDQGRDLRDRLDIMIRKAVTIEQEA